MAFVNINTDNCNSFFGGVQKVFLAEFVDYKPRLFNTNYTTLFTMPSTLFYEVNFVGNQGYTDTGSLNNNGLRFEQGITLKFNKAEQIENIDSLTKQRFRVLVLDNNGNYKVLGLENGLRVDDLSLNSGSNFNEFSQNEVSLRGLETKRALIVSDIDASGITIFDDTVVSFLLQENGDFLLQENGDKIII